MRAPNLQNLRSSEGLRLLKLGCVSMSTVGEFTFCATSPLLGAPDMRGF